MSVEVTNSGDRPADEVVQLYIHQRHGSASRPVRELKGFERVSLEPGESRTVQFTLGPAELRYWNAAARDWVIDASTFDVWVGGDSTAELVDDLPGDRRLIGWKRWRPPGSGVGRGGHHLTSVGNRSCGVRRGGRGGWGSGPGHHLREDGQQVDDRVSRLLPVDVACAAHLASRGS